MLRLNLPGRPGVCTALTVARQSQTIQKKMIAKVLYLYGTHRARVLSLHSSWAQAQVGDRVMKILSGADLGA
jgi:hypothetical protein